MLKIGDKVKINPSKLDFYKKHTYSFVNLDEPGIVSQIMKQTAVVMYDCIGYNIDKNDLYVVESSMNKVYVICAMFNEKVMYVVGKGEIGFSTKDKAREYFHSIKQDWTATHYEIRAMDIM